VDDDEDASLFENFICNAVLLLQLLLSLLPLLASQVVVVVLGDVDDDDDDDVVRGVLQLPLVGRGSRGDDVNVDTWKATPVAAIVAMTRKANRIIVVVVVIAGGS
jgi:hypothetical protein